jgi:hypothetical protein
MKWLKTSEVTKVIKAEIKARLGLAANKVSVRKSEYGNIVIDVSACPTIVNQAWAIANEFRSGKRGVIDDWMDFKLYRLKSPYTGGDVVWNEYAVTAAEEKFGTLVKTPVRVFYQYVLVEGAMMW